MTNAQYIAYLARQGHVPGWVSSHRTKPDLGPESLLQKKIYKHCEDNRCLCFSGSMAHKTKRRRGEQDFTLLLPKSRVLFIEVKSATGKWSQAQLENKAWAGILGHTVHEVDSFEQFLGIFNAAMKSGAGCSVNGGVAG